MENSRKPARGTGGNRKSRMMDYWEQIMQDDVYILVQDGWKAGTTLRQLVVKKGEKLKETPDLVIAKKKYKADLIPPKILIAACFSAEQAEVNLLQAGQDAFNPLFLFYILASRVFEEFLNNSHESMTHNKG